MGNADQDGTSLMAQGDRANAMPHDPGVTTTGREAAGQLVAFIQSLPDFRIWDQIDGCYDHVGATLADAVLQANNNYERNVRGRIDRIRKDYADCVTLKDLQRLLHTITAQKFLHWNGTRKPDTFRALVNLLAREGVDTEAELRTWLRQDDSKAKLLTVPFVGPKTADYLKILVGLPTAAIDIRLLRFLERAGLGKPDYDDAQRIIHQAADLMKVGRAHLDHSIWRYMSPSSEADSSCDSVSREGSAARSQRPIPSPHKNRSPCHRSR